jgi:hypothetical protein
MNITDGADAALARKRNRQETIASFDRHLKKLATSAEN